MIKKAVNVEAKLALRPRSSTKKIDQNCPLDNWPANSIVTKSQGSKIKDPRVEKPKVRGIESLSGPQYSEFSEKPRKEKKKKQRWRGQERQKGSTLATEVNLAETGEPRQKTKKLQKHLDRDLSMVTCFNCDKKSHYANTCVN